MIKDKNSTFCSEVALNTGAAGTYNVGDIMDLGAATRDIGQGFQLYLVISVSTAATSGGAATGAFRLVSDSTSTISTTTATVHATSGATAVANMTAGATLFVIALPQGTYERYLAVQQITGAAAFTAGKIEAFLTLDPANWIAYADGDN